MSSAATTPDQTSTTGRVAMPTPPPYEGPSGDLPTRIFGMKVPTETSERFDKALHSVGWRSQRDWLRACVEQTIQQAGV